MAIADRWNALVARQLGHPRGFLGRVAARKLNEGNRAIVAAAVSAAGLRPGDSAADVGFGGGVGLPMLLDAAGPDGTVHGYDISDTAVALARRDLKDQLGSGRLVVARGALASMPVDDASLDAVITVNTVYFVEDLPPALAEQHRVLRPGGRLVTAVADPDQMRDMAFVAHGFIVRPVPELIEALQDAGFTSVDHRVLNLDGGAIRHLLIATR